MRHRNSTLIQRYGPFSVTFPIEMCSPQLRVGGGKVFFTWRNGATLVFENGVPYSGYFPADGPDGRFFEVTKRGKFVASASPYKMVGLKELEGPAKLQMLKISFLWLGNFNVTTFQRVGTLRKGEIRGMKSFEPGEVWLLGAPTTIDAILELFEGSEFVRRGEPVDGNHSIVLTVPAGVRPYAFVLKMLAKENGIQRKDLHYIE